MINKRKLRYTVSFVSLILITLSVLCINIFVGSADIEPKDVIKSILSGAEDSSLSSIIWRIRIPRVLAAMILGGSLALSGYLLQTFFHNPIAGPFVLGISSGAKLVVAVVMVFSAGSLFALNSAILIMAAFAGSMITLAAVLLISHRFRSASMLVVCGVMIGYICSAVTDFIVNFANDSDIVNLHNWSRGSFSGTNMSDVKVMFVVSLTAFAGTFCLSKPIGAYRLGENYAMNLGVKIKPLRAALIILSGILSACVTAFAGPVSFVGIAVPHIIRTLFKTSEPIVMIPACFLGGSIFCMVCDMIARTAFAPSELSISTVTAIFGAPIVIAVMLQKKRGDF